MSAISARESRTCVRCGRTGTNAFRPIPTDAGAMGWLCTHEEPCIARMRVRHRSGVRQSEGRPPTSPIASPHINERPACVIGSDRASVDTLASALSELAAMEVDQLDCTRRSLEQVSRRDYGLVVVDARDQDPVAFVNELSRRLATKQRHECTVVVCRGSEPASPAIEHLIGRLGARSVERPISGSALMAAVTTPEQRPLRSAVAAG